MRRFDPTRSLLAGMDPGVLQAQLNQMQLGYLQLSQGGKGESFSYTQGDGGKTVTYTRANLGALKRAIELVQLQLGILPHSRALGVRF